MGRSKFPGKPSKHIHRKRVNVLPPTGEISNVECNGSVTVDSVSVVENKQDEDLGEKDSESLPVNNVVNTKVSIKRRLTRKMKSSIRNKNASKRNLLSKMCNKTTVKTKINKGTRTSLTRKGVHSYTSTCRSITPKETTNLVGKFVLPTRSVHSSRVIKPNKRFISDLNESLTLKKKVSITKRHCVKQEEDKTKTNCSEDCSFIGESDKTTFTNGHRVVLRQARLKLPNQIGTQGPFSTKPNTSPPGTVTCGVCGAVRFYRFVKQARKFNIYSCESCRKFIAKMIKRQACGGKNTQTMLVCNKGQGTCHVPPIVRSQQWKLTKCAYRARCPACWLKMCLRAFHMPPTLKQALTLMLPKNMQGLDVVLNNTLPPLLWQAKVEQKLVLDKPHETTSVKQRPVRFKNPKTQTISNPPIPNSDIRRQKIDLKGPRVKHVCRSASIVLGQPIATFTDTDKKCDTQDQSPDIKVSEEKSVYEKNDIKTVSVTKGECMSSSPSESESNYSEKISKIQYAFNDSSDTSFKREKSYRNITNMSTQSYTEVRASERKKNLLESQNGILIDFWDGYDPENVCQNGFCIIGSEQFPMSAICFLCGSAGREAMLYCSICCEPYHPFCLEDAQAAPLSNMKQGVWVCPRCTKCYECNQIDRQKLTCHKCLKAYHPECFNPKWNGEDKPTICAKCLRCKSCGTSGITKFVGNMPLCMVCFKLRKKGNFCPMCQHCYDENECCSKMMECAKCTKWVHAKCENVTDEQYNILSALPESVEYFCSFCSKNPYWRKAISDELRSCFGQVLRQMSKNKTARNLLKWSPLNNLTPSAKVITHIRKLQFSDEDTDLDNNNYSKDITDVNKIYSFEENEKYEESLSKAANTLSIVDIRNKVNSNGYASIKEFNKEIEEALNLTKTEQLLKIYQGIFHDIFPWYDKSTLEEEPQKIEKVANEEPQIQLKQKDSFTQIVPVLPDTRICGFCKGTGDGENICESRLLYCGQNEWVHANCALWSSEVYEEIDGSLQNVQTALNRGRLIRCSHCKLKGASIGCCHKGCHETYHFTCARTAGLAFMHDKTVYCSSHEITSKSHVITVDEDFEIRRSIYVELEQKRKKYCEIDKVNFMVGSLYVKNLGKIDPLVSDCTEAIIPLGFICSRLFWSTVQPWKLVPYTITTSVQNYNSITLTVDKNFTVDHTLEKTAVEKIMRELNAWQRDIDKKSSDIESEDDEEQQNGADILSPELTDAILEELPHDLLDGISVQDIFPKFSYDDLINMDYKSELSNLESITENYKKTEIDEDIDLDIKTNRELRRTKSDIMSSNKTDKSRPSQRSCSLTLSCKLDSSLSPAIKRRKMAAARENNMIYQLLQVDGNCDDSSSSECGSPTGIPETDPWGNLVSEEPVTCEKCQCTYRTQASYKRHLDACEVLCTSESDSEMIPDQELVSAYVNPTNSIENSLMVDVNEPVVISSFESYQSEIHTSVLNTQSFVASKASSSELITMPQATDVLVKNLPQTVEQKPMLQTLPVNTVTPITIENPSDQTYTITQPITISDPSISISTNQPQFCVNQAVPLCVNQPPLTLQQNSIQVQPTTNYTGNPVLSINPSGSISINQLSQPTASIAINQINQPTGSISLNQINQPTGSITLNQINQQNLDFHQPQSVTIQSVPYNNAILNVGNQNQFSLNGKLITNPVIQTVNVPGTQWVKHVTKPTVLTHKSLKSRGRSRTIAAKRSTHFEEGDTIILPNSTGQVIVQHLPSTNYVPTFVEAFQQPGQNLQYVATITPQVNTVPAQSLVQIQPENNIISIVPGLPQTMYIQQPRVLENQLVVDSNGTLGWSQQQTVQPVYYGFETIVQNTVMQSQQFLPTTMPGVLTANSSYSTTTQVFQTSKLEPVLDVPPNSFVLVNPGQLVNSQPIVNTQPINSQSIVNAQHLVNSQQPVVSSHQIEVQYSEAQPVNIVPQPHAPIEIKVPQQQVKYSQPHKPTIPTTSATHSINLPTAPFVPEHGIPTNIVTPIPKPPTSTQSRPMSRVLPMPTNNTIKESKKVIVDDSEKIFYVEEKRKTVQVKSDDINKPPPLKQAKLNKLETKKFEILQCKIIRPAQLSLPKPINQEVTPADIKPVELLRKTPKLEPLPEIKPQRPIEKPVETPAPVPVEDVKIDTSLKLVFQKQGQDGTYKISNNFIAKHPVQVAPLKPIKSNIPSPPVGEKQVYKEDDRVEEKIDKLSSDIKSQPSKKENDNSSSILYTIETQDGFKYSSSSIADLWTKVLEAVQSARAAHNMPPLPTSNGSIMNSIQILGFKSSGLKYLIEQLPGASKCSKYKSMFNFPPHPNDIDDEYSQDHLYGTIRCAPYENKNNEPFDMFGWLSSKHRQPEEISLDTLELLPRRVVNLPMAMKFRQLKLTSKYSVGVYRSCIHGRGLFCLRDIEAGEMVIEYAGEVIRSILTDKREKYYNSKGIGCYMFRVDDNFVVDATMKGNAARFINHSCDPNCYSRVVEILGHKHIIIFALRRILSGEELTYDYKFPFEEDKIPCTCGSRKCRKFLN
ncbi:hypothetical protein NQ315_010387 [Exocentrus adspersus]|uniref:Histone-lysine N-methyltransferase trithorax n=1 Tax=Exocentrus adspersus TaxID=1586481 RepID=A0AAV8WC71_9CUCU|nr:hypothetical protein NQ315_010387 [Exocentrus adspersus]